jgi:hypothetical protein
MRFRVAHLLMAMTLSAVVLTAVAYFTFSEIGSVMGFCVWMSLAWLAYSRQNTRF